MSRLRLCKRCGGSGSLLRPQKEKLLTFRRCSDCGGKGLKGMVPKNEWRNANETNLSAAACETTPRCSPSSQAEGYSASKDACLG